MHIYDSFDKKMFLLLISAYHNDSHHDEAGAGGDVHRCKDGQQEDGFQGDVVLIRGKVSECY